jgi:hypothetical protein
MEKIILGGLALLSFIDLCFLPLIRDAMTFDPALEMLDSVDSFAWTAKN